MVFVDSARELLDTEQAQRIGDALQVLNLAVQGETDLDRWFPDLVGREPELPAFRQAQLPPLES